MNSMYVTDGWWAEPLVHLILPAVCRWIIVQRKLWLKLRLVFWVEPRLAPYLTKKFRFVKSLVIHQNETGFLNNFLLCCVVVYLPKTWLELIASPKMLLEWKKQLIVAVCYPSLDQTHMWHLILRKSEFFSCFTIYPFVREEPVGRPSVLAKK